MKVQRLKLDEIRSSGGTRDFTCLYAASDYNVQQIKTFFLFCNIHRVILAKFLSSRIASSEATVASSPLVLRYDFLVAKKRNKTIESSI